MTFGVPPVIELPDARWLILIAILACHGAVLLMIEGLDRLAGWRRRRTQERLP